MASVSLEFAGVELPPCVDGPPLELYCAVPWRRVCAWFAEAGVEEGSGCEGEEARGANQSS